MTMGLVLGGGGITGIAWELGLLAGLAQARLDLSNADRVIGTSAGSVVGAQITSATPLAALYETQLEPPVAERLASIGTRVKLGFGAAMLRSRGDLTAFGRHLGGASIKAAAAGRLPSLADRYAAIGSRLPSREWPEKDLRICVVNARTGQFQVFDRDSKVALIDAVAASCAVPSVYPPVPIGTEVYVDGGIRSGANVDVAQGCDRVVVLAPIPGGVGPMTAASKQLEALLAGAGVRGLLVSPDAGAKAAIGKNVLDPAARPASARAGFAQATSVLAAVREVWSAA
jgi:NTE family protein